MFHVLGFDCKHLGGQALDRSWHLLRKPKTFEVEYHCKRRFKTFTWMVSSSVSLMLPPLGSSPNFSQQWAVGEFLIAGRLILWTLESPNSRVQAPWKGGGQRDWVRRGIRGIYFGILRASWWVIDFYLDWFITLGEESPRNPASDRHVKTSPGPHTEHFV